MTKRQKENAAKYFYDISKGTFLLSVVGSLLKTEWDIALIIFGMCATMFFYIAAYIFDGGDKNE